jgi:hypothetical protein
MKLRNVNVVFGLLFATNAFAGTTKSICNRIGPDQRKCLNLHHLCFWDEEDQRCEPYREPPRCARHRDNPEDCNETPRCAYDVEDQRCEEL